MLNWFQDKKADLIINTYVDDVLEKVLKKLGVEIANYDEKMDPTGKTVQTPIALGWNITKNDINQVKILYDLYCKRKRKVDVTINKQKKIKTDNIHQIVEVIDLT